MSSSGQMCKPDSFNKTSTIISYSHCSRQGGGHHCSLRKQTKMKLVPVLLTKLPHKKKKIRTQSLLRNNTSIVGVISSRTPSLLSFPSSLKLPRQVSPLRAASVLSFFLESLLLVQLPSQEKDIEDIKNCASQLEKGKRNCISTQR